MGLWDWLTGLAAVKILFRGTDTYYRKEREAEKREEHRRKSDAARAYYQTLGENAKRDDAADLSLRVYHKMKKMRPYDDDKALRAAAFGPAGFTDAEARAIVAGQEIGTTVAGRAQGPLPGRPVTSMADESLWEET